MCIDKKYFNYDKRKWLKSNWILPEEYFCRHLCLPCEQLISGMQGDKRTRPHSV